MKEDEIQIDEPIKLENGEELTREQINSIIKSIQLEEEQKTKRGVTKKPVVSGKAKKKLRKLNKTRRKQK